MFLASGTAAGASVVPIGLTHVLIITTTFLSLFFGVAYTAMRRWWLYQMGWNLFVLRVAIGLVLLPATVHYLFGVSVTSALYQWATTIIFVLVPVALAHITLMLFQPAINGLLERTPPELPVLGRLHREPAEEETAEEATQPSPMPES